MAHESGQPRRRFFGCAGMAIVAAQLGTVRSCERAIQRGGPAHPPAVKPGTHTSFGSLQQIDAGVLNVGYAEAGPADGPAVILLHGWPYDIHSYRRRGAVTGAAGIG